MAKIEPGSSVADPRSKTQQSVRLYDREWALLDRWEKKLSPGMPADRAALIRRIFRLTEFCLDMDIDELEARNK